VGEARLFTNRARDDARPTSAMSLRNFASETAEKFRQYFGQSPRWMVAAPGRVNLIGEHTDYNDGFVLPMAIDRYTVIAAAPNRAKRIILRSAVESEPVEIDLTRAIERGQPEWANYPRGVMAGYQRLGFDLPALDAFIDSTVPLGGGLSSSAALEVATATLIEAAAGRAIHPVEKALLCQRAEDEFAGVPSGIMDQFTSVLAQADNLLLLDCRSRGTELVPLVDPSVSVLIVNTNVRHALTGGEYAQRRAQCEAAARALGVPALRDATMPVLNAARARMNNVSFRRARHVITENERTLEAARAIRASDWAGVGQLMYASHASLRDDFEVSCAELDLIVELARGVGERGGMIGCRMTGGGFGGCTVSLVHTARLATISAHIAKVYRERTGIEPSLFVSRPAAGARVL
jgi:galactokinase